MDRIEGRMRYAMEVIAAERITLNPDGGITARSGAVVSIDEVDAK